MRLAGPPRARSLNIELQTTLNPAGDRKVERVDWTFAPGDKVMTIENDYEVYNGEIGYIDDVEPGTGQLTAQLRRQNGHLRVWRTRHAGCLPMRRSQEPGLGISSRTSSRQPLGSAASRSHNDSAC